MVSHHQEVQQKLSLVRQIMARHNLGAAVFRGSPWFTWLTAGGSSRIPMGAERGIAETCVTADRATVTSRRRGSSVSVRSCHPTASRRCFFRGSRSDNAQSSSAI